MALFQRLPFMGKTRFGPVSVPVAIASIALAPLLAYTIKYYRKWLSLGPGRLPRNIFGFAIQTVLQLVARHDTKDEWPFSDPNIITRYKPYGEVSFLAKNGLPMRRGSPPDVPGFAAPQRQITERGTGAMKDEMSQHLETVVAANPDTLVCEPSRLEGGIGKGIYLADRSRTPDFMPSTKGEMVHVHMDCSSHVILSLADAKDVTRKGWGQRFTLAGVGGLPWTYMFIYAPRDDDEFKLWKQIVHASLSFVTSGEASINAA